MTVLSAPESKPLSYVRRPSSLTFHIFDFSSEIQRNLTGSKISTSYSKIFVFRVDRIKGGRPGLWSAEPFSTSLKSLNGIQWNLTGTKISKSFTKFVFSCRSEKKMAALASDRLRHFRLLWNRWTEFKETLQEPRSQSPLQVCVFMPIGKRRWPPWSLIGWDIFDFSSEATERIQRNLSGSKISTSSTKFVFSGRSEKQKDARPLIGWAIFLLLLWIRLMEFDKTWQVAS